MIRIPFFSKRRPEPPRADDIDKVKREIQDAKTRLALVDARVRALEAISGSGTGAKSAKHDTDD